MYVYLADLDCKMGPENVFGAFPLVFRTGSLVRLQLVFVECSDFADNDPGNTAAKVESLWIGGSDVGVMNFFSFFLFFFFGIVCWGLASWRMKLMIPVATTGLGK
jgi:hypothetical protein